MLRKDRVKYVRIRVNTSQRKPEFWQILCEESSTRTVGKHRKPCSENDGFGLGYFLRD